MLLQHSRSSQRSPNTMSTELRGFGRSGTIKNEFSSQIQLKSTEELFKPHPCTKRWVKVLLVVLVVLLAAGGGFLVGYFIPRLHHITSNENNSTTSDVNYQRLFVEMVDRQEMMDSLRFFTSGPHVTTSPAEQEIAEYLINRWSDYGFEVEQSHYQVPISFPSDDKPNMVTIIINNDTKTVEYSIKGQINMTSSTNSSKTYLYTPYIAYTPNGTVQGELVYANRGTAEDFKELKNNNITVNGRIVIMSSLFANIKNAQEQGAIGAIVYSDPVRYAQEGHGKKDTYPNSPWLPPDAVQRISALPVFGDPYTPNLVSKRGVYRLRDSQVDFLKIPAQTISYHDAEYILSQMGGPLVPKFMKGALNIDYRFGPSTKNSNTSLIVKLEVNNQIQMKKIRNIIATIPGSSEPDRIVFIGNHRDSWTFGSSDPSSGTTTLAEISRVLSNLLKRGWRPRRTIKLCSWGGEEMGLLGSQEWVEENDKLIRERGVAYLNTDVAVGGSFVLHVQTGALLYEFILNHTKKIQDPLNHAKTLYDTMLQRLPKSPENPDEPLYSNFQYVSDNFPFEAYSGLPTADFSFFYGYKNKVLLYPVYHTQYDTFEWIHKFADPEFRHFQAAAQLLGSMLMDLADCKVLPFSVQRYGKSLQNAYNNFRKKRTFTFVDADVTLNELELATQEFVNISRHFEGMKQSMQGSESILEIRKLNDQMMSLEKTFMSPYSNTFRLLFFNGRLFSVEAVFSEFNNKKNSTEEMNRVLHFQMSLLTQTIRAASSLLKPV